ncbi:MAG: prepilin-type N-terminal cleavage/methylation domain-containing protein [Candidatus Paceibacterota bacterium]
MRAFTLIELLLSIALLSIIVGFSVSLYPQYGRGAIETDFDSAVDAIRYAQISALSGKDGSDWCVRFEKSEILVYEKDSLDLESDYKGNNRKIIISESASFSGINDVCFDLDGYPNRDGKIELKENNDTRNFFINKSGILSY